MIRNWERFLTSLVADDEASRFSRIVTKEGLSAAITRANEEYGEGSTDAGIIYSVFLIEQGNIEEAENILANISSDNRSDFTVDYLCAKIASRKGDIQQARKKLDRIDDVAEPDRVRYVGRLYRDLGCLDRADTIWGRLNLDEVLIDFLIDYTELKIELEDWEGAKKLLERGLERTPNRVGLWGQLSKVSRRLGNTARALEAELEYLERFDGTEEEWFQFASEAREQNCFELAQKGCRKLIELNPFEPAYRIEMAYSELEGGDYEEAISRFEKADQKGADTLESQLGQAFAALELGDLNLARKILNPLSFENEANRPALYEYLYGRLQIDLGNYGDAEGPLTAALEFMEEAPELYRLRAIARLRGKDDNGAQRDIDRAMALSSEPFLEFVDFATHLLTERGYRDVIDLADYFELAENQKWQLSEPVFALASGAEDDEAIEERFARVIEKYPDKLPVPIDWERFDRMFLSSDKETRCLYESFRETLS